MWKIWKGDMVESDRQRENSLLLPGKLASHAVEEGATELSVNEQQRGVFQSETSTWSLEVSVHMEYDCGSED